MTSWQFHPLLLAFQLGGLLSLAVVVYCVQYVQRHGTRLLVLSVGLLAFNNAIWVLAAMLKTASADLPTKLLFYKLQFFGAAANPSVGVVLALTYIGAEQWLTRRTLTGLALVPAVTIPLVVLNPGNVMIVDPVLVPVGSLVALEHSFPPLFGVYLLLALGLATFAAGIVTWGALRNRVSVAPAALVVLTFLVPVIIVALKVTGVYPPGGTGINVTPAVNGLSIALLSVALVEYGLLELTPVGRDRAVEVMQDGYLLVDTEGTVVDANDSAATLLGQPGAAALTDRPVTNFVPVPDGDETTNATTFTSGERSLQVLVSTVSGPSEPVGRVLMLRDVTDQRAYERQLERKNERLEEFASIVSHDLRNPLNVAMSRLELLAQETDSEHVESLDGALDRMERLIDDLLTLAREGSTVEATEQVALASLANTCWSHVETPAATLKVETDTVVHADETRLEQLLENLFRNAIDHGRDTVTITVGDLDNGFYVEDDGLGIPSDDREQVFESGYSTADGGTGFGLTIVAEIAAAHGWDVAVTDGTDGGARFEFTGVERRGHPEHPEPDGGETESTQ